MFQVEWLQSALDELSGLWLAVDQLGRQAITAAAHAAEMRLRRDPLHEGESRGGSRRVTFAAPLTITFQVEPDDMKVVVIRVHLHSAATE